MRNPFRRSWEIERYDVRTKLTIMPEPPEQPRRLYWTERGAVGEVIRLNSGALAINCRWRFRVVIPR